ncbi:MAG TPA: cyclic nucleotide-binding domain-containing protein, partial [Holophaga sp.]|nr:cyclic nucleotide-binding domain-containing protein [Holophaga sp.]
GETILAGDHEDACIYFLIQGHVTVSRRNGAVCELRRLGDLFGESRFLGGAPGRATVTATTDTVCLRVDLDLEAASRVEDMAVAMALIYRSMAQVLSERLRRTSDEARSLRDALARRGPPA